VKRLGTWLVILGIVLVLGVANNTILEKEHVRTQGRVVLLELRPVDPRSLIQGDYMMLRYSEKTFPRPMNLTALPRRGTVILSLDADHVGTFVRLDDGTPLADNEVRLDYRTILETGELGIGAESYFFEEGQSEAYAGARFGVLRVADDGASVLVGLADEQHRLIAPASR